MKPYYDYDLSYICDMIESADLPYKVIGMSDCGKNLVLGLGQSVLARLITQKSMQIIMLFNLVLTDKNTKTQKNSMRHLEQS